MRADRLRALVCFGYALTFLTLGVGAAGCSRKPRNAAPRAQPTQAPPPALPEVPGLVTASGAELRSVVQGLGTRGALVNAWATWCGSCKQEIPMLVALRAPLNADGIALVFVSVDEVESRAGAVEFLKERAVPLPSYWAAPPLTAFKEALNPRWPGMLPATFLYDAAGKLRYFWGGPALESEILAIVRGFVAGEPIDGEALPGLLPGRVDG